MLFCVDSYDVQNVSITVDKEGVLCATCYFLAGSEAGGCVVELNVFGDDTDYTSVHLSRTAQQNEITGCIKNLLPGRYRIQTFDIEKEGIKLTDATPAFIIESITIPELIQPTESTIPTSISSTLQSDTTPTTASEYTLSLSLHLFHYYLFSLNYKFFLIHDNDFFSFSFFQLLLIPIETQLRKPMMSLIVILVSIL